MSAAVLSSGSALSTRILTFGVVCALLYFGQVVLIPIALAALISFLVTPLIRRIAHRFDVLDLFEIEP